MERELGATASRGATEFAARLAPGHPVRWNLLEAVAFRDVSSVFASVPPAALGWPRTARDRLLWVVVAPIWVAPYAGGFSVAWRTRNRLWGDAFERIPTAGACYALLFLGLLAWLAIWLARGSRWNPTAVLLCVTTVGLGAVTFVNMSIWGGWLRLESWIWWAAPVVASVLLAAAWLIALLVAYSRMATATLPRGSALPDASAEVRRRQVARIPVVVREEITADIRAAITDLEARGVISTEEAWRAREAEPGMLLQRMRERVGNAPAG
ncbi:MAG: hypothetical protein IR160_08775 [Salinibacterium sp.]|nr:hypothetical protein [Salinibacterium sp.]MBF0672665.1 hypothetical protein [Salinibacterium sp.]